jgi:glycosyltransferase involved in cell wall biosynthesis
VRVLWLAKGLGPGGMERLLVGNARLGDRSRFDYRAAYLIERPHSIRPELEALGVACTGLAGAGDLDPRWVLRLRSLVRDEGIDVVHSHSPMLAAVARVALRSLRPRPALVYTEHNRWETYSRLTGLANLATFGLDDAHIAVSNDAASSIPSRRSRDLVTIVHGVDRESVRAQRVHRDAVRAELGIGPDTVLVAMVANLRPQKAYPVALAAVARMPRGGADVVVVSVGQGPAEAELRVEHQRLGLGERFRFLGFRPDPIRLMAGADVFMLSSNFEGLPVALMEAMTLGLPVVATGVGGVAEQVDERSGRLVAPGSPDALAAALAEVVSDAELRQRLGAGAAEASARFDAAEATGRIEQIYQRVVPGR